MSDPRREGFKDQDSDPPKLVRKPVTGGSIWNLSSRSSAEGGVDSPGLALKGEYKEYS